MSITNNQLPSFLSQQAKSKTKIGHDILSYCTRCKMNLTHTIVTLDKESKPARVLCNTCKSERQYTPKKKISVNKGAQNMERDDELDLDLEAGAKLLIAQDDTGKKKSKAKSKSKKTKEDNETSKSSAKNSTQLPLSLLDGTSEDKAQFEVRMSTQKNNLPHAKEYKATVRFKNGDIISHKTFGIGFVVNESGLNKVEVLFAQGRKLLATGLS
jgi:hypothetical protein